MIDYAHKETSQNPSIMMFLDHRVPEVLNKKPTRFISNIDPILSVDINAAERAIRAKRKEWWKKNGR